MSDLRHRTPAELRNTIEWCVKTKADRKAEWEAKELQIATLQAEVALLRRTWHNIGQKEAWARTYLAQKETGNAPTR